MGRRGQAVPQWSCWSDGRAGSVRTTGASRIRVALHSQGTRLSARSCAWLTLGELGDRVATTGTAPCRGTGRRGRPAYPGTLAAR
jgi:hypothetical protein